MFNYVIDMTLNQQPGVSLLRGGALIFSPLFNSIVRLLRAATNESPKTLNKCETRNKTVFHTRLRHSKTINSVPLNSVLRIKQIGV